MTKTELLSYRLFRVCLVVSLIPLALCAIASLITILEDPVFSIVVIIGGAIFSALLIALSAGITWALNPSPK